MRLLQSSGCCRASHPKTVASLGGHYALLNNPMCARVSGLVVPRCVIVVAIVLVEVVVILTSYTTCTPVLLLLLVASVPALISFHIAALPLLLLLPLLHFLMLSANAVFIRVGVLPVRTTILGAFNIDEPWVFGNQKQAHDHAHHDAEKSCNGVRAARRSAPRNAALFLLLDFQNTAPDVFFLQLQLGNRVLGRGRQAGRVGLLLLLLCCSSCFCDKGGGGSV